VVEAQLRGFLASRAALIAHAVPGTAAAEQLATLTDEAASALAEAAFAGVTQRWALVATGGYGARRLLPHSDLDLLVVTDASPSALRPAIERLLYPLWDAGFEVGHQVRTVRDHVRACREDVQTSTASLTGRPVAGDAGLADEALRAATRDAARRRKALLRTLENRARQGSPYDLEPDLKDGAGGQRDIDELVWRTALATGNPVGAAATTAAPATLTEAAITSLARAQDRITAARWAVHVENGRKVSVLSIEDADALGDGVSGVHAALAEVSETLLAVRGALPPLSSPPDLWTADELLRALAGGTTALNGLERAARHGALEGLVPGMAALMTLRRPALTHRLTVGAHSLLAAALVAEASGLDDLAAQALAAQPDVRVLLAAALAHDTGKAESGAGHPARGQTPAFATAHALGLDDRAAEQSAVLVREHLLLAETAAHEDLDDEEVVRRAAERIGKEELVGPLYVLTLVDSLATGPGAWSDWHATLVRTLVRRLVAALGSPAEDAPLLRQAEQTRMDAFAQTGAATDAVAHFIAAAPPRYLVSRPPETVVRDARLLAGLGAPGTPTALAVSVGPGVIPESYVVTVGTWDRPGLVALIAGSLALCGLDILDAEILAGPDGTALDAFTVASATLAPVDHWRWSSLKRTLGGAIEGHLELTVRLAERRRHYAPAIRGMAPEIAIETAAADVATITVRAADRTGLLYDIADEVARAGFSIAWAKASVRGGVATDTLRLAVVSGTTPHDPGRLGHLAAALRTRCAS
jgi:[protein-PII] uridylyltransferase